MTSANVKQILDNLISHNDCSDRTGRWLSKAVVTSFHYMCCVHLAYVRVLLPVRAKWNSDLS
jgi:hypothetical protein